MPRLPSPAALGRCFLRDGLPNGLGFSEILVETDNDHAQEEGDGYGRQKGDQEVHFPGKWSIHGAGWIGTPVAQPVQPAGGKNEDLDPTQEEKIFVEELFSFEIVKESGYTAQSPGG